MARGRSLQDKPAKTKSHEEMPPPPKPSKYKSKSKSKSNNDDDATNPSRPRTPNMLANNFKTLFRNDSTTSLSSMRSTSSIRSNLANSLRSAASSTSNLASTLKSKMTGKSKLASSAVSQTTSESDSTSYTPDYTPEASRANTPRERPRTPENRINTFKTFVPKDYRGLPNPLRANPPYVDRESGRGGDDGSGGGDWSRG